MSPASSTTSLPVSPLPEEQLFFKVQLLNFIINIIYEFWLIMLSGVL